MEKNKTLLLALACAGGALAFLLTASCGLAFAAGGPPARAYAALLVLTAATLAALAVLLYRWILAPLRSITRRLAEFSPKSAAPFRLDEDAGLLSPLCRDANRLFGDYGRRYRLLESTGKRYRLLSRLYDDVIFEFDLARDRISDSSDWEASADGERFIEGSVQTGIVHPDDAERFRNFFRGPQVTGELREMELRLRTRPDGDYQWTLVRGVTLGDTLGRPDKIIGRRLNIDRIRRENDELRLAAERDLLTGLYNKRTAELLMESALNDPKNPFATMFLIDIDQFKAVNDTLGHQAGDEFIRDVAAGIAGLFRHADIVGRVGGDEFLVLLCAASASDFDEAHIRERCGKILERSRRSPAGEKYRYQATCSIGVAIYPGDGGNFSELFRRADAALYAAKRLGRNRFVFHQDNLDLAPEKVC